MTKLFLTLVGFGLAFNAVSQSEISTSPIEATPTETTIDDNSVIEQVDSINESVMENTDSTPSDMSRSLTLSYGNGEFTGLERNDLGNGNQDTRSIRLTYAQQDSLSEVIGSGFSTSTKPYLENTVWQEDSDLYVNRIGATQSLNYTIEVGTKTLVQPFVEGGLNFNMVEDKNTSDTGIGYEYGLGINAILGNFIAQFKFGANILEAESNHTARGKTTSREKDMDNEFLALGAGYRF